MAGKPLPTCREIPIGRESSFTAISALYSHLPVSLFAQYGSNAWLAL
jgi:hypothetical protein